MDTTTAFEAPTTFMDTFNRKVETKWATIDGMVEVTLTTRHNKDRKAYVHTLTWVSVRRESGYNVRAWSSDTARDGRMTPVARHSTKAMEAAHDTALDTALDTMVDLTGPVFIEAAEAYAAI